MSNILYHKRSILVIALVGAVVASLAMVPALTGTANAKPSDGKPHMCWWWKWDQAHHKWVKVPFKDFPPYLPSYKCHPPKPDYFPE
jgi:hypothetical protein